MSAGLTKKYRNRAVVDHVTFTVPPGQVTGYLGPNGSGKSTTVKMLAGLLPATSGQILWDGADIRHDLIGFKRRLGYVPEEAFVYPHLSGLEYLQLIGRLRQLPERLVERKATELLRLLWLHEHRYSPISAYSKGMKQRVLIASALLHDPDLLILDEPLSGLDITSALLLHEMIAEMARARQDDPLHLARAGSDGKGLLARDHAVPGQGRGQRRGRPPARSDAPAVARTDLPAAGEAGGRRSGRARDRRRHAGGVMNAQLPRCWSGISSGASSITRSSRSRATCAPTSCRRSGFVAVPGMFAAFAMLPTGVRFDQPFANGWELVIDYYFFVLYSMVVMGFVMVFEWDALFPDRKDYIILTPLPLGGQRHLLRESRGAGPVPRLLRAGREFSRE